MPALYLAPLQNFVEINPEQLLGKLTSGLAREGFDTTVALSEFEMQGLEIDLAGLLLRYSSRNAVVGSIDAARRAGSHDEIAAIVRNSTTIAPNVVGSVGFTPTSIVVMMLVRLYAATRPAATPAALSRKPWPTIRLKMLAGSAPIATRTPISAVR
jgi:hypothetical protein